MKQRNIKLIISFVIIMIICLACSPDTVDDNVGKNQEEPVKGVPIEGSFTVSKGNWSMTVNAETGDFILQNSENGYTWYSNPVDKEDDTVAAGFNKMNLSSQIIISFITPKSVLEKTNNFVGSIRPQTFECLEIGNGVRFNYVFEREGFKIPLEFRLDDGIFRCEILTEEIEEFGENYLSEIQLLPFFGAGGGGDEGYIMIPDGSGALIKFGATPEKARATGNYTGYVYGRDPVLSTVFKSTITEAITVPMFGIKNKAAAFLAVIEQGDMVSKIMASPGNKETSYTSASPALVYRSVDNAVLREMQANEKSVLTFNKANPELDNYCVAYHLLPMDDADYSGMARLAGSLYFNDSQKIQEPPEIYLELTAGAQKGGYFLGIPVKNYLTMTNLKQADEIISALRVGGISNIRVKYDSWNKGGGYTKMPVNAKFQQEVEKGMKLSTFLHRAEKNSSTVFFTGDLVRIYQSGNGIRKNSHSVRAVSGGAYVDYIYKRSTYRKDKKGLSWTYLQPNRFEKIADKHVNSMNKKGIKTYGDLSSGWNLPSDSRRPLFGAMTHTTRQKSLENYRAAYQKIKSQTDYMLFDGGLGYTFEFASDITSLPSHSSGYGIFDEDIPFVQMILHGYVNYSANPINLASDYKLAVLKSVEYGAIPTYSLVYENEEQISETPYNTRYSVKYSEWKDKILETSELLREFHKKTAGASIIQHRKVADGVYEVTYSNGVLVYVNYGSEDFRFGKNLVSSESFGIFENSNNDQNVDTIER